MSFLPSSAFIQGPLTGIENQLVDPKSVGIHKVASSLHACIANAEPVTETLLGQMGEVRPPAPVKPVRPDVDTTTQAGHYAMEEHYRACRLYIDYVTATKICKEALFNCLDKFDKNLVAPGGSYYHLDLRHMYAILWNKYHLVSNNDLSLMHLATQEKMNQNGTVQEHIAKFRTLFTNLATVGNAIIPSQQTHLFLDSLPHKEPFNSFLTWYNQSHNNPATRIFEVCAEGLITYVNNDNMYRRNVEGTANATQIAKSATHFPTPTLDSLARELQKSKAEIESLRARFTERATGSKEKGYRIDERKMQSSSLTWCWTHGECYHNSKDCREHNRDPGHNERATATKPMGSKWGPHESKPKAFKSKAGRSFTAQEDTSYEAFKFHKEYQEWLNTKED